MNLLLKTNYGRDRKPNSAVLVAWNTSSTSAKSLEPKVSFSLYSFYWELADYYSQVFSLIHPVDEFSFKEMRTWVQSKVSYCGLCDWCKSREIGGMGRGGGGSKVPANNGGKILCRPSLSHKKLLDRVCQSLKGNVPG